MRWLENGNKKVIGQIIFAFLLLAALAVLFLSCAERVPIKMSLKTIDSYDYCEVVNNKYLKSDEAFKQDVEAYALYQVAKKNWARYEIRPFEIHRVHGKYIGYAVIYYWKEK